MRIRLFNLFLFVAMLAVMISSCKKPTGQAQRDLEQEYLSKYIAKYHPTVTPKKSGLYFIETKAGSTAKADTIKVGDVIKVFYGGHLIEEDPTAGIRIVPAAFDSSGVFEPFSFTVGSSSVIAGWDEAVTYMKDGSEAKLVIPSKLAYSSSAQPTIPAYSPLVFFIKIVKVQRSTDVWPVIEIRPKTPIVR